jgi:hypothetical protein
LGGAENEIEKDRKQKQGAYVTSHSGINTGSSHGTCDANQGTINQWVWLNGPGLHQQELGT